MVIEETGSNMLYLIFGFLEYYEREDSEKPLLAPLLAVPVVVERDGIDEETRNYQYSAGYNGEDIRENYTLIEKLSKDLSFHLPSYSDEDNPVMYFKKIEKAISNKNRWRLRYQLSIGFLSFGKLAIWADLDPARWPRLLNHKILNELFSGCSSGTECLFAEDYVTDTHPQADLPLIYDADSSQHSAIIDVLSGKNMVINGPPGTGKSQTITNIIASALSEGKKVLFVSEKLAALQVVHHRLNKANLGTFCLELHSHKTKKKKLLTDLQERLDCVFQPQQHLQSKLAVLSNQKDALNRYAELMRSCIGNELGLSVSEIFWRTERCRQAVGNLSDAAHTIFLPEAKMWSFDKIEKFRSSLTALGQLYEIIGSFSCSHPWWGFSPKPLTPGDDKVIGKIISEALTIAYNLSDHLDQYLKFSDESGGISVTKLNGLDKALSAIPEAPENLISSLLPAFFNDDDPRGTDSSKIVNHICTQVNSARELLRKAGLVILNLSDVDTDEMLSVANKHIEVLTPEAISNDIHDLKAKASEAKACLAAFNKALSAGKFEYGAITNGVLEEFEKRLEFTKPLDIADVPLDLLLPAVQRVRAVAARLSDAFKHVRAIAKRRSISFDGSPSSVTQLSQQNNLTDVHADVEIDDTSLKTAVDASLYIFADLPLTEINERRIRLVENGKKLEKSLGDLKDITIQIEIPFDGTALAVIYVKVIAKIAQNAPLDLIDFRTAFRGIL